MPSETQVTGSELGGGSPPPPSSASEGGSSSGSDSDDARSQYDLIVIHMTWIYTIVHRGRQELTGRFATRFRMLYTVLTVVFSVLCGAGILIPPLTSQEGTVQGLPNSSSTPASDPARSSQPAEPQAASKTATGNISGWTWASLVSLLIIIVLELYRRFQVEERAIEIARGMGEIRRISALVSNALLTANDALPALQVVLEQAKDFQTTFSEIYSPDARLTTMSQEALADNLKDHIERLKGQWLKSQQTPKRRV